tara:strand:+ start:3823 stop:5466 length:1644 start_codon:yes stop_codon:yes gene_type:complete
MMRIILFIFLFVPLLIFSQTKKEFSTYIKIEKLISTNELLEAEELTRKLLKKNKKWKKPHLLLHKIYWAQEDFERSEFEYFIFYDININNLIPILDFAKKCFTHGFYNKSIKYLDHIGNFINDNTDPVIVQEYNYYINNCKFAIELIKNPVNFTFKNMGSKINSEYSEYLPYISADGNKFIFTRKVDLKGDIYQEDFYFSEKNNNIWGESSEMTINTLYNEGSITLSPDGKFLVFTSCNRKDGIGSCDLYFCEKVGGIWSVPKNLSYLNTRKWESQPCFSPDMKYLYFVSNRNGGYGGDDIWRSEIGINGFLKPENLGPIINTKHNEMSPYLHPDNITLYFSSKGHLGMGDYDLFFSKRKNSESSWNIPENLGYPINSHRKENSLIVSSDGKTAYFTSDIEGYGKEDIFYFKLPYEKRADSLSNLEINIITQKIGNEIIFENVNFESNSYQLTNNSYLELDFLVNFLQKNLMINIHIEGHTDDIGNKDDNLKLSNNRAKSVYDYLLSEGISSTRLTFQGYGEQKPLFLNNNDENRRKNRRTSFIITE